MGSKYKPITKSEETRSKQPVYKSLFMSLFSKGKGSKKGIDVDYDESDLSRKCRIERTSYEMTLGSWMQ